MVNLYSFIIRFYQSLIRVSSAFNPKAKQWVEGRRGIFDKLQQNIRHDKPIAWFHCASLGEFEQGRPVIEAFRNNFPDYRILLTFFSPSGYEVRKNYSGADYIFYLPADTRNNAQRFVQLIKPAVAVFVKYEFWYNYLSELKKAGIPMISISAIFRPGQRFFKRSAWWQRAMLRQIDHFFVQNQQSEQLLHGIGIRQVSVSGDTRFDRVSAIVRQKKTFPLIESFRGSQRLFLAGSTWPKDEELLFALIRRHPAMKFIIAPHEVHPARITALMQHLPANALKFSVANPENIQQAQVLVIDSIGILSHLYRYATIAYIGGGFGVGIHNILEAATFGKPVIFGPNYHKFQEARELISLGGAFTVSSSEALLDITRRLLHDEHFLNNASETSRRYVEEKKGATAMIIARMKKLLPGSYGSA